jgi:hypothetical protein
MSFITFTFIEKAFNGQVIDTRGQVVYVLSTDKATWSTEPTWASRGTGEQVGQLAWGGLTHSQRITLGNLKFNTLLKRQKDKWYSASEWVFNDFQGGRYHWKNLDVREISNEC